MACAVGNCLSPLGSLKRPAFCGGPELVVVLSLSLRRPDIISTASDRSGFPQFRQADGFDHYFSWLEDYFRIINERELACPSRYGRPHRRAVPRSPHLEKMPRRGRGIIEQARRKPPGSPRCVRTAAAGCGDASSATRRGPMRCWPPRRCSSSWPIARSAHAREHAGAVIWTQRACRLSDQAGHRYPAPQRREAFEVARSN